MNEGLHPVCAFLTHRFCDMAVAIQGKSCGIMSHVFLNRLDIITRTDGINCEGVTAIMQTMMIKPSIAAPFDQVGLLGFDSAPESFPPLITSSTI